METTLTIRLSKKQRDALNRRARAEGRSVSAVIRDLLERETTGGFDFERVRHLVGSVKSSPKHWERDPWLKHLHERNWRS